MLYADDEPSAEVYSAASDRSQASLVFNVAKQIVEMTPALMKRSKIMAATKRIVNYSNAGFYQVLSADVGCVSEDTVLQLSDGSLKRADEIQPGDMILSFDGLTPVFDEVVSVREEEPSPMVEVLTGHGRRTCVTEKHPFYKMESGRRMQDLTHVYDWEEASELKKNDRLAVALGWPENYEGSSSISTLEAWALGAWAGDGDCTHFRFINPDKPVIEKMRGFLEGIGSGLKSTYSTRQKEAGTYPIVYIATDASGNKATVNATLTVVQSAADEETVKKLAKEVIDQIITDDMSGYDKLYAIYYWVRGNIRYQDQPNLEDWLKAAYDGLKYHQGDCYVYCMTSRALLDAAGIKNMVIDTVPLRYIHFWNLVDIGEGWYHFDTTPRASGGTFLYMNDADIQEYSRNHQNAHSYDHDRFPGVQ